MVIENQEKRGVVENKCGGGIDLFTTYVCREEKKKKKKEKKGMYTARKKKKSVKKLINVPFPMI